MRINHNIPALKANNSLGKTNKALDKSLERLSSGYRINRASDDAAGMAISQKMKTQIAGLNQASRNAADGISVIQTAEGALQEVGEMLQRMRELAVQAANGTNADSDRKAIQQEINQLNQEINRISDTTEYNTMTLLDGNLNCQSYSNMDTVSLISLSDTVGTSDYTFNVEQDARQAVLAGIQLGSSSDEPIGASGTININGCAIEVYENETVGQLYSEIRSVCDTMSIIAFVGSAGADPDDDEAIAGYTQESIEDGGELILVSEQYGSSRSIELHCDSEALRERLGIDSGEGVKAYGVDAVATLTEQGFERTATVSADGNVLTVTDLSGFEIKFEVAPGTAGTDFTDVSVDGTEADISAGDEAEVTVTVLSAGPMDLQIGANEGQMMEVRVPKVSAKTLGVDAVNVCTQDGAVEAISLCDVAIDQVSAVRAKLGAYENRLDHAIANLKVSNENITEALSRIEDADMAEEMTVYTQKNVLSQAGTSMLAQANERPQTILSLLQ